MSRTRLWLFGSTLAVYVAIVVGVVTSSKLVTLDWQVFAPDPSPNAVDPADPTAPAARMLGYDAATEARRRAKKELFRCVTGTAP